MRAYYEKAGVRLFLGDCLEVMGSLPSRSVDAAITDPPYNVGLQYGGTDDARADYEEWCRKWFVELCRVAGGFNPIAFTPGIVNLPMWYRIAKPTWVLSWWKPAAMGRSPVGFNNWEPMLLYGKTRGKDGCDVVRASIKPTASLDGHPCPKPLEWGVGSVALLTKPDDLVLDPFTGSGTIAVACVQTGRRFVGCEIHEPYAELAAKRIEEASQQFALFDAASQNVLDFAE